jgi:hypothetical protein
MQPATHERLRWVGIMEGSPIYQHVENGGMTPWCSENWMGCPHAMSSNKDEPELCLLDSDDSRCPYAPVLGENPIRIGEHPYGEYLSVPVPVPVAKEPVRRKNGKLALIVMDWAEAIKGNYNVYYCNKCKEEGTEHQIINVPAGDSKTWGVASHLRRCTGCGVEDGPWVPAEAVGYY